MAERPTGLLREGSGGEAGSFSSFHPQHVLSEIDSPPLPHVMDAHCEPGYNAFQGQLSMFEGLGFVDGRRPLFA